MNILKDTHIGQLLWGQTQPITQVKGPLRITPNIDFQAKAIDCKKDVLNLFYATLFRIIKHVLQFFERVNQDISTALDKHCRAVKTQSLCNKFVKHINLAKDDLSAHRELIENIFSCPILNIEAANYAYASCKYHQKSNLISGLIKNGYESVSDLKDLSPKMKTLLYTIICISHGREPTNHKFAKKLLETNPKVLFEISDKNNNNVLSQIHLMYQRLGIACKDLALLHQYKIDSTTNSKLHGELSRQTRIDLEKILKKEPAQQLFLFGELRKNIETNKVKIVTENIKNLLEPQGARSVSIHDISFERMLEDFDLQESDKPLNLAVLSVEYTGFLKQGGLAEAVEGMTKAFLKSNPSNTARLIFPKYHTVVSQENNEMIKKSIIPKIVLDKLKKSEQSFKDAKGNEIVVETCIHDGVEVFFIDSEHFKLDEHKPNIYGPTDEINKKRYFAFTELASHVLYQMRGIDVVHLHDWHVAGIALKLHKDHPEEWKEGKIPPFVFTFHNNNRAAQGRTHQGCYDYEPVIVALRESGIADDHVNIFAETIQLADMVTTVSENFAKESQLPLLGEGVSFATTNAAKVGKLVGILNGIDTTRWNPETNENLLHWIDKSTNKQVNLTYGVNSPNAYQQKQEAKVQLSHWLKHYFAQFGTLDPSKPLLGYIGRLDSYQKGMDKVEEAIEAILIHGGQFILMGSQEDKTSTKILDRLVKKYEKTPGVIFIRDNKTAEGKYKYQDGNDQMPGCGDLVRAAVDMTMLFSRYEPGGLVQIESFQFGAPVIASNTGGLADTIITKETSPSHFNGYLFERDAIYGNRLSNIISKALKDWKALSDANKDSLIKRIMHEGKQHGWATSPSGYSPIEKLRAVYHNAIKRIHLRKESKNPLSFDIHEHIHKITKNIPQKINSTIFKEEGYLKEYYINSNDDDVRLDRMYYKMPEKSRSQVPAPHRKRINYELYKEFGAFIQGNDTEFVVHAPAAKTVRIHLYDNEERLLNFLSLEKDSKGIWKGKAIDCLAGQKYQLCINGQIKIDPYALSQAFSKDATKPPYSVVTKRDSFEWKDDSWLQKRAETAASAKPMNIYEVHLGSWKRDESGNQLNYRHLAHELVAYCRKASYTHVELMGVLEHPSEHHLGAYRVSGYFAINSRMGSVDDFKYLINHLHVNEIGVFLDWVPGHSAKEDFCLSNFDGSTQFELSKWNPLDKLKKHFCYDSMYFDYGKKDTRQFLISSAAYFVNDLHFDGIRVDAVQSMLNTAKLGPLEFSIDSYSSKLFLRQLNAVIHANCKKGVLMMAEDYSGNTHTSIASHKDGLGFDLKWDVNWKHHTLDYFALPLNERQKKYQTLIAAIENDNFHKLIKHISHDEIQFSTLIDKNKHLPSDTKHANVRAMISFMMCLPGKKLLFMGIDNGASCALLDYLGTKRGLNNLEGSSQLFKMVSKLNSIYLRYPALWEKDDNARDLEWIEKNHDGKIIIAYRREDSNGDAIVCLHNFASENPVDYTVVVKPKLIKQKIDDEEDSPKNKRKSTEYESRNIFPSEIFNTDKKEYGGHGRNADIEPKKNANGRVISYKVTVPPLSTIMIREIKQKRINAILEA